MEVYSNVLDMVGRTPMLKANRLDTGPCELYLKLELANPGGSVKDRIGISMIEEAEKAGIIFMVAFVLRYWPEFEVMHEACENGRVGAPLQVAGGLDLIDCLVCCLAGDAEDVGNLRQANAPAGRRAGT